MAQENLTESFRVKRPSEYSIYHTSYVGLSKREARLEIINKLRSKQFAVNNSTVSQQALSDVGYYSGRLNVTAKINGIAWTRCRHDGTDETGEIFHGQPVVFDTSTGRGVTGIHSTWIQDEFKIVGIALKSFNGPSSGNDIGKIPIKLSDIAQAGENRLFELTESLSVGSSAMAKFKVFNGNDWDDDDDREEAEVFDSLGTFEGEPGDYLWAFPSNISLRWEIFQLEC